MKYFKEHNNAWRVSPDHPPRGVQMRELVSIAPHPRFEHLHHDAADLKRKNGGASNRKTARLWVPLFGSRNDSLSWLVSRKKHQSRVLFSQQTRPSVNEPTRGKGQKRVGIAVGDKPIKLNEATGGREKTYICMGLLGERPREGWEGSQTMRSTASPLGSHAGGK